MPRRSYDRRREQTETVSCTLDWIMTSSNAFVCGVLDVRRGIGFRRSYETWDIDRQWNYERGRQWATVAPQDLDPFEDGYPSEAARKIWATADPP